MTGAVIGLLEQYRYWILFPLAFVAQPQVGMASGILARFGYLDIPSVYIVVVSAALIGDCMWYWIGYRWGERFALRFGRYLGVTVQHIDVAKRVFNRYHAPILVGSKVVNGLGLAIAILFTAGLTRVPFLRYMFFNLIGETVWSAMIIGLGYFFGDLYIKVESLLGRITLVALFFLFIIAATAFARYMSKRIQTEAERG